MKKLVLFFAAVVAVAFASCGAKETTEEATDDAAVVADSTVVVADTTAVVVDSAAVVAE